MSNGFVMGATLQLEDRASSVFSQVRQATQSFTQAAGTATSATNTYRDSQGRLRNELGHYVSEAGKGASVTDTYSNSVSKLRGGMSGLATAIKAVAGAAVLKKGFDWLVGANADMETYKNTLTVVLGSQEKANAQLEWANKFAASTPFEIPQIIEATTRMSSYGLEAKDTLGIIGDMASVMGKDLMQAVEAVADAQTGEVERLKEFGITKDMIAEQAKLLGKDPINAKGQITDMKAFNEALFSLMDKRFKGGMEIQSKSFKGMLSNMADFVGSAGRTLGKPIFDGLKNGLSGAITWLNQLQESGAIDALAAKVATGTAVIGEAFKAVGSAVSYVFDYMYQYAASFVENNEVNFSIIAYTVTQAFGKIKEVAVAVFGWLRDSALPVVMDLFYNLGQTAVNAAMFIIDNWKTIKPLLLGVAGAILTYKAYVTVAAAATKIWTAATKAWTTATKVYQAYVKLAAAGTKTWTAVQAAFNSVMSFNPIMLVVIGIGLLVGALIIACGGWDNFKNKVIQVWTAISAFVAPAVNAVKTVVLQAFTAVATWAATYWPRIQQIITAVWTAVKVITEVAWAYIGPYVMAAVDTMRGIIEGGFNIVLAVIRYVWNNVVTIFTTAWTVLSNIVGFIVNMLTGNFEDAKQNILNIFKGLGEGIVNYFKGLGTLLFDSGKAIMETLANGIKNAVSAPLNAVKGAFGKIRELLPFSDAHEGPLSQLTLSGKRIMTTLGTGVNKGAGSLYGAMNNAFSKAPGFDPSYSGTYSMEAGINPAGTAAATAAGGKTISIAKLVENINLHDVGSKDTKTLVKEILAELYEAFKNADEIVSEGDLGVVL